MTPTHVRHTRGRRVLTVLASAVLLGPAACASESPSTAESDRRLFTEQAARRGISGDHSPIRLYMTPSMNGGGGIEDLDGDGDLDIYLTKYNQPNELWLNDGTGTFSPDSALGLDVQGAAGTPLFADVDGDDDLDAFITPTNYGRPYLMIRDAEGFHDETDARGIALSVRELAGETGSFAYGARFVDIDQDGDLDLLVGEWGLVESVHNRRDTHRSYLFINDGTGRFQDRATEWGLAPLNDSAVFGFVDHDVDGDGFDDLLVAGDFGTSRVMRSVEGHRFADVTSQYLPRASLAGAGGAASDAEVVYNAMGSTLADVNADGKLDWLVTAIGEQPQAGDAGGCARSVESEDAFSAGLLVRCTGNRAYSLGANGLEDITESVGIRNSGWSWGVVAEDLDVDGRVDVAITNGYVAQYQPDVTPPTVIVDGEAVNNIDLPVYTDAGQDRNFLWLSGSSTTLSEDAPAAGFGDTQQGRALVGGDIDRDGDIDILQVNDGQAPPLLFTNNTNPTAKRWLTIRIDAPNGPPSCIGCVVTASGGDETQVRKIAGSGSFSSSVPAEAHFGFATDVDSIEVTVKFPDGATTTHTVQPGGVRTITAD